MGFMSPHQKLRTAAEVADILGLTRATIWKMCREKRIPHHAFGREVRFSEADLLAILQESRVDPETTMNDLPVPVRGRR